jgi:hypothetical protein
MDLIERYIYSVGRLLPGKNRRDIENELRSLIMDALDERTQGETPTEDDIIAVLKELGEPSRIARNYLQDGGYIIGPRFYSLYMLVIKIALAATAFGLCVAFAVEAIGNGVVPLDFLKLAGQIFLAMFSCVGVVTVTFALTERLNPNIQEELTNETQSWNPKDLPGIPDNHEKVKASEQTLALIFTVAFFVLINFFPQLFGFFIGEKGRFITLIDLIVLKDYLPFINVLFGLSLVGTILLLAEGRYRGLTFALEIIGSLGAMILAIFMLSGPVMVDVSLIDSPELKATLSKVLGWVYRGILVMAALASATEAVRLGNRWLKSSGRNVDIFQKHL